MDKTQNYEKFVAFMGAEPVQKAVAGVGSLHRKVLNAVFTKTGDANTENNFAGIWYFAAVELMGTGLQRKASGQDDYYFEFSVDGTVAAHVHGKVYETTYCITDGCISFGNAELAALKLKVVGDTLRLSNYLGTTLTFVKRDN